MPADFPRSGPEPDETYWRRRADEQLAMAARAQSNVAAAAHRTIAQAYAARAQECRRPFPTDSTKDERRPS